MSRKTFLVLLVFFSVFCFFQKIQSQTKNEFVSYTSGFSINLPARYNGYSGIGTGIRFEWRQSEAEYEVGSYEYQNVDSKEENTFYSEQSKQYAIKFSAKQPIYEKEISINGKSGYEYKFENNKSIFLLRLFLVEGKYFQLQAEIPLNKKDNESKVLRVFDSFQILDEEKVRIEKERRIKEATPKDLPQSPIVLKAKSDAEDENLKGKVKSVQTYFAKFDYKKNLNPLKPSLYEEFNEKGNLLKSFEYDSFGEVLKILVYGYIAGKRVADWGSIQNESSIGGIEVGFPSSEKFDNRYAESFSYKYLNGNLIEAKRFFSNGFLYRRSVYSYSKGKRVVLYYDGGTFPYSKVEEFLDDKNNEIKSINYRSEGKRLIAEEPYILNYDSYDENGNWTKRTVSRQYESNIFLEYVETRKIEYYK
jgi:hypothetical protein